MENDQTGITVLVVPLSPTLQNIDSDFAGREVGDVGEKCEGTKQGDLKLDKIPQGTNNGISGGFGPLSSKRQITPADIFWLRVSTSFFLL